MWVLKHSNDIKNGRVRRVMAPRGVEKGVYQVPGKGSHPRSDGGIAGRIHRLLFFWLGYFPTMFDQRLFPNGGPGVTADPHFIDLPRNVR